MRLSRRIAAVSLVATLFVSLQVAAPAMACACGAPAPLPGADLEVNQERAIVSWVDGEPGVEQIDLRLGMLGSASETGLIFPTPAPASVSAGDTADFIALEEAIAPKVTTEPDWWSFGGDDGAPTAGAPPTVLDEVQLGPVTATTLEASDATGLSDWLNSNGYVISSAVSALLVDYVDRGWYFVALKLASDTVLAGGLDPIRFTFDSDELVYPMDLSQAAETAQEVRLYVLDEHRVDAAALDTPGAPYSEASPIWAGEAPAGFEDRGRFLTVLDLYLADPATQAVDLAIVRSATDDPITRDYTISRPATILGLPLGVAAILLAALLIVAVVGIVTLVRRGRARPTPPRRA